MTRLPLPDEWDDEIENVKRSIDAMTDEKSRRALLKIVRLLERLAPLMEAA